MTYYFYDLETTGFSASSDRIIQFSGQRFDQELNPVGAMDDYYVKVSPDIVPKPSAILYHKIMPLTADQNGLTEFELLVELNKKVFLPETLFCGYNSINFDDNFIRHLLYRNFYDPFSWHRDNNSGSWDIFQITAFTRDLRPGNLIKWPKTNNPRISTVKLAALAEANNLVEISSQFGKDKYDVEATVAILRLIKKDQPQLFDYLFNHREADQVKEIISTDKPFVMGGHVYDDPQIKLKTTVAFLLSEDPIHPSNYIVYDLRFDPDLFSNLSNQDLETKLLQHPEINPFYQLATTKSPPVAPLSVLRDKADWSRLLLSKQTVRSHYRKLINSKLNSQIRTIFSNKKNRLKLSAQTVDNYLYYGKPLSDLDRQLMEEVRRRPPEEINPNDFKFNDPRFNYLLPLYKARNWPKKQTASESAAFERYLQTRLRGNGPHSFSKFKQSCQELSQKYANDDSKIDILRDLYCYVSSKINLED